MKMNKTILGLLGLVMLVTAVLPAAVLAAPLNVRIYVPEGGVTVIGDFVPVKMQVLNDENTGNDLLVIAAGDKGEVAIWRNDIQKNDYAYDLTVNVPVAEVLTKSGLLNILVRDATDADSDNWTDLDLAQLEVTLSGAETPVDADLISKVDLDEDTVAPGDKVTVEVELRTDEGEAHDNVKLTAWIDTLDGTKVETREFNIGKVHDDDEKTKVLTLDVPEDADQDDYTIKIEARSNEVNGGLLDTETETLTVERNDDSLQIVGDFSKVKSAKAGSSMNVQIELLNNGLEDQTNVEITAELVGTDAKVTGTLDEIQQDMSRVWTGVLKVPADLADGRYNLAITAQSKEGAKAVVTQELSVSSGSQQGEAGEADLNAEGSTSKDVAAAGGVFQATLENTGSETATFTLSVGDSGWIKSSDISPKTEIELDAGDSKTVNVFVVPKDGETGSKTFTLYVKSDGRTVDSIDYTAKLATSGATGFAGISNLVVEGLQWLFAVLVVVAVVLFILWLGKKGGKKGEGEDDKVYY